MPREQTMLLSTVKVPISPTKLFVAQSVLQLKKYSPTTCIYKKAHVMQGLIVSFVLHLIPHHNVGGSREVEQGKMSFQNDKTYLFMHL